MDIKKWLLGFIIIILSVGCNLKCGYTQSIEKLGISPKELIERLARIEENQKNLQQQIDGNQKNLQQQIDDNQKDLQRQIDGLQRQIEELKNFIMWSAGITWAGMFTLLGCMGALFGFVMWDRRTALAPAVKRVKILEEQEEKVEKVLRDYASKEVRFAQAMRAAGLL